MFDLSLGEIGLVVAAAVIFIGPKELPVVIKGIAGAMASVRGLMHDLRGAFDDLAKESGYTDTKESLENEIRMIRGDDGKLYESYDMTDISGSTPKPQIKDFSASKHDDDESKND
jgi:sec-independent protein translocase protein TatB